MTMTWIGDAVAGATDRLTAWEGLDRPSAAVGSVVRRIFPPGPVRDLASGVPAGHPVHPMLVVAPLGLWSGGLILDLGDRHPEAARALVGMGVAAALPAALAGWSDWLDTAEAEQRVGLVHAGLNGAALAGFAASWWLRRPDRRRGPGGKTPTRARLAAAGGGLAMAAAGWLGGHLAYSMGVGVDTNAFEGGPTEWTDVAELEQSGDLRRGRAGEVPVVVIGASRPRPDGASVMAERCSHRGGPLSEGRLVDNCVECPWHASRFDASTGRVRRGPASIPQPVYELRTGGEGLQ
ncbi:MAG TPA: DUF2231 domain-containing protein, partial [Acidimicrobiales bacterium]|nr:DUF2231 domain-containing protein [Acidimicrobiales bacterium]